MPDNDEQALIRERQSAYARNELAESMRQSEIRAKPKDNKLRVIPAHSGQCVINGQCVRFSTAMVLDDVDFILSLRDAGVPLDVISGKLPKRG